MIFIRHILKFRFQFGLMLSIGLISAFSVKVDPEPPSPLSPEADANQIYLPMIMISPPPTPGPNRIFYLSPNGNDSNTGASEQDPWATLDHAWQFLYPGDTLVLLDGIYYQSLDPNERSGEPGNPITIRAKNDGKAIIDGQGNRSTVDFEGFRNASYYVLEGIVARNSSENVYRITADNVILRRVSGFNANTDGNNHVFVIHANNTLIEDCVAAGSGRKMMVIFKGENNVIRRCFADWQEWDGREWHDCWPWGDGIEIYNSSYNTIENSISYSRNPTKGFNILSQGSNGRSNGNKILGSMSVLAGMYEDGTPYRWGDTRPQPTQYTCVREYGWPGTRVGFNLTSSSEARDNLWQDIFSWGSASYGFAWRGDSANAINNRINQATIINNGLDDDVAYGGKDAADTSQEILDNFVVENSRIDKIFQGYENGDKIVTSMSGEGAHLTNRYVDGVLTNEPLWPWPMEERIQAELGVSVTEMMTNLIFGTEKLNEIYPRVEISTASKKNQ
jgi:hypothetical protein